MFDELVAKVRGLGVVPVIALDDPSKADDLAGALLDGGLPVAEVTFRAAGAAEAIRVMANRGDMLVGAGTVRSVEQAQRARDAGAAFLVTPGFSQTVVDWALAESLPILPGVDSTVALEMGAERGLTCLKFFPAAASGGIAKVRALGGPYPEIEFVPTGGIGAANLAEWLAVPSIVACGGSWLVKKELLAAARWDRVAELTREATAIVSAARNR